VAWDKTIPVAAGTGAEHIQLQLLQSTYPSPTQELESARKVLLVPANSGGQTRGGSMPCQQPKNRGSMMHCADTDILQECSSMEMQMAEE